MRGGGWVPPDRRGSRMGSNEGTGRIELDGPVGHVEAGPAARPRDRPCSFPASICQLRLDLTMKKLLVLLSKKSCAYIAPPSPLLTLLLENVEPVIANVVPE